MKSLVEVLTLTTAHFRERGVASPRLDAELLLGHVLGLDRVGVYLNFDRPLTEPELATIRGLVRRRAAREPLAWILGTKEFYGRDFLSPPRVLVPRPDTETLVEAALEWVGGGYVADLGCGTGCIGLTLALERPEIRVYAVDLSDDALAAARANVERHALKDRVAVLKGDLLAAIPAKRPIDWVISNPPYIPRADLEALEPEVRDHEPRLALDGGADGLEIYRRLVPAAAARARLGVLVEVGAGQSGAVAALMRAAGLVDVESRQDLGKVERVVRGRVEARG